MYIGLFTVDASWSIIFQQWHHMDGLPIGGTRTRIITRRMSLRMSGMTGMTGVAVKRRTSTSTGRSVLSNSAKPRLCPAMSLASASASASIVKRIGAVNGGGTKTKMTRMASLLSLMKKPLTMTMTRMSLYTWRRRSMTMNLSHSLSLSVLCQRPRPPSPRLPRRWRMISWSWRRRAIRRARSRSMICH